MRQVNSAEGRCYDGSERRGDGDISRAVAPPAARFFLCGRLPSPTSQKRAATLPLFLICQIYFFLNRTSRPNDNPSLSGKSFKLLSVTTHFPLFTVRTRQKEGMGCSSPSTPSSYEKVSLKLRGRTRYLAQERHETQIQPTTFKPPSTPPRATFPLPFYVSL